MTTAPNAAAAPAEITLGGKVWKMSPLTMADRADFDRHVQQRVIRIAREVLTPDMPRSERQEWMEVALMRAQRASMVSREGLEFSTSTEGVAWIIWLGLRKNHKGLTVEKVHEMLDAAAIEATMDVFNLINGVPTREKKTAVAQPLTPPPMPV